MAGLMDVIGGAVGQLAPIAGNIGAGKRIDKQSNADTRNAILQQRSDQIAASARNKKYLIIGGIGTVFLIIIVITIVVLKSKK